MMTTKDQYDAEFAKPMRELRCPKCHRLLMREFIVHGRLEIKCACGELCRFVFRHYSNATIKTAQKRKQNTKIRE